MKSLNNDLLFENLSVTELEERLEMTVLAAIAGDGDHSCSSIDCLQYSITRAEELSVQQAVQSGQISVSSAQYLAR
jgi:hypothetical protein